MKSPGGGAPHEKPAAYVRVYVRTYVHSCPPSSLGWVRSEPSESHLGALRTAPSTGARGSRHHYKHKGGGRPKAAPHPYSYPHVESLGRLYLELFVRPLGGFLMAHYAPTPRTTGGHVRTYVRTLRVGTIQAGRGYPYTIPRCFFCLPTSFRGNGACPMGVRMPAAAPPICGCFGVNTEPRYGSIRGVDTQV